MPACTQPIIARATRPEPPRGVYLQLYRGAIRGGTLAAKRAQLARYVDTVATMVHGGSVVAGVVMHGFCEDLASSWPRLAALGTEREIPVLASWGLDSRDLTARRKGELVASVLREPSCAAGLLDAEGQWDSDLGAADDMDEAGALELSQAIIEGAPGACVGDQPWYAIESHGDVRRTMKPMCAGSVFQGFPVDEFATVCTWGRFRQAYIYNKLGLSSGYAKTFARMDHDWQSIAPALASAGLSRPTRVTLQAYGWKLHELVDAILLRGVLAREPLVFWCDPWPDAVTLRALAFVDLLVREGFTAGQVAGRDAVRAFQLDYNARARSDHQLAVDGWAGDDTVLAGVGAARG